jgi:hypothetical protein
MHVWNQSVAITPQGLDITRMGGLVAKALAKQQHALGQVLRGDDPPLSPDSLRKVLMRHDARCFLNQHAQEVKTQPAQWNGGRGSKRAPPLEVERNVVELETLG